MMKARVIGNAPSGMVRTVMFAGPRKGACGSLIEGRKRIQIFAGVMYEE